MTIWLFALGEKTRALTSIEQQHNALRDETRGSRTQAAEQTTVIAALQLAPQRQEKDPNFTSRSFPAHKRPFLCRQCIERAFPLGSPRRTVLSGVEALLHSIYVKITE